MAQTGYTPIQLYYSSTTTNVPLAANLASGELAINITDGKLFYKDNANAVQVIGWKVVPATAGGTGQTSYAVGDLLYADTTTTLAKLPDVATGNALISGGVGVAPSYGKIGLTTHVSGVLPVANVGTNASAASITAFNNITGYTASGATGTTSTNLVFSTSPSITTPTLVGDVTVSTGNVVIGTSGKGIDFSATPSIGTSELFADYEEGTFTPTIVYSGTNTPTYVTQLGRYTKIGRMVQVQIYFNWNENGSTGNVTIGALPFTSVTSNARAIPSIFSFGLLVVTSSVTGFVNSNATTIYLALNDNAATALSATNTDNDQDMYVTVTYEAA
jgi:hypothetical protein